MCLIAPTNIQTHTHTLIIDGWSQNVVETTAEKKTHPSLIVFLTFRRNRIMYIVLNSNNI